MTHPSTPTLDKMSGIKADSQKIGDFLEWLFNAERFHLSKYFYHYYSADCDCHGHYDCKGDSNNCAHPDKHDGTLVSVNISIEKLLAKYFDINLDEVEKEKRLILDTLRKNKSNQ